VDVSCYGGCILGVYPIDKETAKSCYDFSRESDWPVFGNADYNSQHNPLTIVLQLGYTVDGGERMDFYTVRDMRTTPKSLWDSLSADGGVVITNNGKPTTLMLDISDGSLEETLKAVRQAKAMIAFNTMRERAAMNGFMTDEEIEAEIAAARTGE